MIRRSQLKTLTIFQARNFTVREFAEHEKISTPSARSRLIRLRDQRGWLVSKKIDGPTSPMDLFRLSAKGKSALRKGLKEWKAEGIDALA